MRAVDAGENTAALLAFQNVEKSYSPPKALSVQLMNSLEPRVSKKP
jgi:hypothetical protein